MKAVWQGHIALGQLGIAVRLYSATRSGRPQFVQLHEKDSSPVERVLKCSAEDKEIPYKEIVRAVEYQPGRYITLTGQELERNLPASTKIIEVKQFCEYGEIDPIYFEKPYYIVPAQDSKRAYALLREALSRSQKAMVVQFVLHNREHIGVIRLQRDLLILNQLRFSGEMVPRSEIKTPALPRPAPAEINALRSVIEHFSGPFYAEDYHDNYTEEVHALVERKIKGLKPPRRKSPSVGSTPDEEIVEALQNTLSENQRQLTSPKK